MHPNLEKAKQRAALESLATSCDGLDARLARIEDKLGIQGSPQPPPFKGLADVVAYYRAKFPNDPPIVESVPSPSPTPDPAPESNPEPNSDEAAESGNRRRGRPMA